MPHEWAILNGNLLIDNSAALMDGSGGYHHNVRWTYVHMDGGVIIDPHVGFYRNPPPDAKCRWSTNYGERAPHNFNKNMLTMPGRELWLWNDNKLKTVADQYKHKFWRDLKTLERPKTFLDLYEYFDAGTLWYAGAYNLWNLMNMLVTEAHQRWPAVLDDWKGEIEQWVRGLLYEWKGFEHNQNALRRWDQRGDPLVDVEFNEMFNVGFGELGPAETTILRDVLINHYYFLTGQVPRVGLPSYPYYPRPFDNVAAPPIQLPPAAAVSSNGLSSKAIVIANSDVQKRSSSDIPKCSTIKSPSLQASPHIPKQEHHSPQQPSPPASLTSIPEEAGAETIEPSSPAEKETEATNEEEVAEPVIPKIVTDAGSVQADAAIRDRKDSNGSLDAMFFHPSQPLRLEVSDRQPSTRSAPDQPSEPMLGTAVANKSPAKPHHQNKTPTKSSSPSNSFKFKSKGKQSPWRLQHRSPPRHTSCPPYHPTGATPPHSTNTGPPPPYVPSAAVPNNLPPHSGMVSGPPGPSPHPQPGGFLHLGPPPLFGAGIGPAVGPAMPFQNQLPMQQHPPMGQQNFNQGMPSQQPMSFPNATPPFQQHGAQDFQARHNTNNGGFTGGQKSSRRNSNVSSGSRKVRDDPVHGAIYSLRESGPRKNSNGSSTRRPSVAGIQCNNTDLQSRPINQLFSQRFRECPCPGCDEATRSIYIKGLTLNPQANQVKETLFMYFGYIGPLAVIPKRNSFEAMVVFRNDTDAVRAVNDFQHNPDKSIRGLSQHADVWYPIFSKHYFLRENFHRGPPADNSTDRESSQRRHSQSRPRQGSWRNGPPGPGREPFMIPQQFPVGNNVSFVPVPSTPPQRTLWEPTAKPPRGSTEQALPAKVVEKPRSQMKPNSPTKKEGRAEELRMKEDWRSKPPSEEAIEEDGEDESVAVDTVSNHSSQGSRSIIVCLPSPQKANKHKDSDNGAAEKLQPDVVDVGDVQAEAQLNKSMASSRTIFPDPRDEQPPAVTTAATAPPVVTEAAAEQKATTTDEESVVEEAKPSTKDASEVKTLDKAAGRQHSEKNKNKRAAAEEKAAPDTTEPSGDLAPRTSTCSYRKTTTDLSAAVTTLWLPSDTGTVVRRKQPRPALPPSWIIGTPKDEQATNSSSSTTKKADSEEMPGERLLSLRKLMEENEKNEAAKKMIDVALDHLELKMEKVDEDEGEASAHVEEPQQTPKKKAKHKKEWKAQGGTPADAQPHGPFPPASSHATASSASRGPSPVMQSHDHSTASRGSTTQSSKNNKKKKFNSNKRYKNRIVANTSSGLSGGQAKSDGSQDEMGQSTGSSSGQPVTKAAPRTKLQPEAAEFTMPSGAAGPSGTCQGNTLADAETIPKPNKDGYRANNGGSLRMKKNRSPEKAKIMTAAPPQERDSPSKRGASTMPTIFEPPSSNNNEEFKSGSPEANLFVDQKSFVNDSKRQEATPTPPAPTDAHDASAGSQLTPRSWSGVVKNEDPFTAAGEGGAINTTTTEATTTTKGWIKDGNAARSPKKQPNDASPTPSPEKKTHKHTKNNTKLSATAPLFVYSRPTSPAPTKTKLNPFVQPFATSVPSSPAQSVVAGKDKANIVATAGKVGTDGPSVGAQSAEPKAEKKEKVPHHSKKPSLPGHSTEVDKRFVTPANQIADPMKMTQPGAPLREKTNTTSGSANSQPADQIPVNNPQRIPVVEEAEQNKPKEARTSPKTTAETATAAVPKDVPAENQREVSADKKTKSAANNNDKKKAEPVKKMTAAEIAAEEAVPPINNNDNFPALGEAAAVNSEGKKKRAASIVKSGTPPATSPGAKATPIQSAARAADDRAKISPGTGAAKTAARPTVATTKTETTKKTEKDQDGWELVGSNKKTPSRAPSGRSGRGGSWRGVGRFGRGLGAGDERKGG